MSTVDDLLQKTSRTFALAIPLLPEPTRNEVGIGYLLFRIVDTFEDATHWAPQDRIDALARFVDVLGHPVGREARDLAADCTGWPPVDHAGYRELLQKLPFVLERFQEIEPRAREIMRAHVERSARGMSAFLARGDGNSTLPLETLQDLRDYCYAVAGIVGEMLTELYLLDRPQLDEPAPRLRQRAARFGEGLQLVNIIKDARPDAAEGRVYLPRQASLDEVFAVAHEDLEIAGAYTEELRLAGVELGLVGFNALIMQLARANLNLLRTHGLGSKLSRLEVMRILAHVLSGLGVETEHAAQPEG
jgi:farnesyl-diphosphate farnesyltransferase